MAIIKLNSKELREVRKDLLKDVSKQEIRDQLNKLIGKKIDEQILEKMKHLTALNLERHVNSTIAKEVRRRVNIAIKDKRIRIEKVTADRVLKKVNVDDLIYDVKAEIKKEVFTKLGK